MTTPGRPDRVLAWCDGDTPIADSRLVYFSAELILDPPWPFSVEWYPLTVNIAHIKTPLLRGVGDYSTVFPQLIKILDLHLVWRLTGAYDDQRNGFEGRWPD